MLYESPSGNSILLYHSYAIGKLYHNADNNNNDGSPTHSIMGFGNVFNEKTNN